ncbi:ATP-binding protein [Methanothermobacter thermautotrophicus]|uniref:ATP-binding protein n=1 Tax=Methanothermobacter thermautotrophicus TaxID=145262 RepID=UPI003D7F3915
MKEVCILSGKGGAGKSSIVASMAVLLADRSEIIVGDCDVDAPNLALILGSSGDVECETIRASERAFLVAERCKSRKKCVRVCRFNAIKWSARNSKPEINEFLCEGCGACAYICPDRAIDIKEVDTGKICYFRPDYGFGVVSGHLKIGERGSGKIVDSLRRKVSEIGRVEGLDLALLDSAAGIGCPVVSSVKGCDRAIIITEPTKAAINDSKRAIELVRHFGIPHSIIINKYDLNHEIAADIEDLADRNEIPIMGRIPYDLAFTDALVNGLPAVICNPHLKKLFRGIVEELMLNMGLD